MVGIEVNLEGKLSICIVISAKMSRGGIGLNHVILYSKENCTLCDEVRSLIELFQTEYDVNINEIDIESDPELLKKYMLEVPVLNINGEDLDYRDIDYSAIDARLFKK